MVSTLHKTFLSSEQRHETDDTRRGTEIVHLIMNSCSRYDAMNQKCEEFLQVQKSCSDKMGRRFY
jgi:hypothetical protein